MPLTWLLLTILFVFIQGFYSMAEMAIVSCNRVTIEYYIYQKNPKALLVKKFLIQPTRMFSTFVFGINLALQCGSQSARELYICLHIDPDYAPLVHIIVVVLFGELIPLYIARLFPESISMKVIPIVYWSYLALSPFIFVLEFFLKKVMSLCGYQSEFSSFLSREEIQQTVESHEENEGDEFNSIVSHIFKLRYKMVNQLLSALPQTFSSLTNVEELKASALDFFLLYHAPDTTIRSIVYLDQLTQNQSIDTLAQPVKVVSAHQSLITLLKEFKAEQQRVAVVVDNKGQAQGIITLHALLEEIFGQISVAPLISSSLIECRFPAATPLSALKEYGIELQADQSMTLVQFVLDQLGHYPHEGESIIVDHIEFIVEKISLFRVKTILLKHIQ